MKKAIFLLMVIIFSACSSFEEDEIRRPIPVGSISVNNISNITSDFTATIFCGSYCWKTLALKKALRETMFL